MNTNLKTLLLLIFLLKTVLSHGQNNDKFPKYGSKPKFVSGYIIDNSGNKIEGLIKVDDEYITYHQAIFFPKEGKRERYTPLEIKEYGFLNNKYLSYDKNFIKVIKEGKSISLYKLITQVSHQNLTIKKG